MDTLESDYLKCLLVNYPSVLLSCLASLWNDSISNLFIRRWFFQHVVDKDFVAEIVQLYLPHGL